MSKISARSHAQASLGAAPAKRRRLVPLAVGAIIIVLGLAWYDGGEEPIRPISQAVDLPAVMDQE